MGGMEVLQVSEKGWISAHDNPKTFVVEKMIGNENTYVIHMYYIL